MKNPPKYVKLGHTEMCLVDFFGKSIYWRENGCWGIGFRFSDGALVASANPQDDDFWAKKSLDGTPFIEISEQEWREGNTRRVIKEVQE